MTSLQSGIPAIDDLVPRVRAFLAQDTMDLTVDAQRVHGYRSPDCPAIWIRDHSDIVRGARYFETDLTSAVEHFAETQAANGRIFDFVTDQPLAPGERENWVKYVRVPVEADVEYRFVKAAYLAWQTTGDHAWIERMLPAMERALQYAFTHPWRWDPEHQLVKRPYCIDSWDFAYTAGRHDWLQFQIDEDTFWGIMHGDNSGYYEACLLLGRIYRHLGKGAQAQPWETKATQLRQRMNAVCWNGTFYTHFVKLTPVDIPGLDEASQLSFSNPMNINRGVTTREMAAQILCEYQRRKETTQAFAEWFSIEPAFPDGIFGEEKIVAGAYSNGGIMPLVGGELARAYLENGFEKEGIATLQQYHALIAEKGETYLWYFPDGTASDVATSTSPEATPTDGWGSSAMLWALLEGLAGVQDVGCRMDRVIFSPKWLAAGLSQAQATVDYRASGAQLAYAWQANAQEQRFTVEAAETRLQLRLLLPAGAKALRLVAGTKEIPFTVERVGETQYVVGDVKVRDGVELRLVYQ